MHKVLLITDGIFHPPLLGRLYLRKILTSMEGYLFHHIRSLEKLPLNISEFSALVMYFHHQSISDQPLRVFDDYLSRGGGVLAIHSATASFKECDRFTDILGGKFSRHGPVECFSVNPVSPESEIFGGIPAFDVLDELYLHDQQPDIQTHFTTVHKDVQVPMVWTRNHGLGRVCYACPGHRSTVFKQHAYREIMIRGLKWAAEGLD